MVIFQTGKIMTAVAQSVYLLDMGWTIEGSEFESRQSHAVSSQPASVASYS
jgi:hypothetical protein